MVKILLKEQVIKIKSPIGSVQFSCENEAQAKYLITKLVKCLNAIRIGSHEWRIPMFKYTPVDIDEVVITGEEETHG